MAWLYALHVRSSITRSRPLQAEHMLSGMRDNVLALISKRHGVDCRQGRGLDDLPEQQRARAAECLTRSLKPVELKRAFQFTVDTFLEEVQCADPALATKLERPLKKTVNCLASLRTGRSDEFSGIVRPSPASLLLCPTTRLSFANWICAHVSPRSSASRTPAFRASVSAR
jgi:hypothetical protein